MMIVGLNVHRDHVRSIRGGENERGGGGGAPAGGGGGGWGGYHVQNTSSQALRLPQR